MSPCRIGDDINKTIHFEKNWKNVARKLQRFCSVYFPGVKKYCRLCSVQFNTRKVQTAVLLGTKYFGRHFSVTSKQINVNQALTSSQ
jgi:hypothetical protein